MAKKKIAITDQLQIYNLLRKYQTSRINFWVFADLNELTEKSPIHLARLSKVAYERLEVRPAAKNIFTFENEKNLMLFCRSDELAFKAKVTNFYPEMVTLSFPIEIFSITEEELDKVPIFKKIALNFSEKRKEKRKSPEHSKFVFIAKGNGKKGDPKKFELLDLAPSGMAILIKAPDEFQLGDEIEVRAFEGKNLKGIIYGEVKSVRELKDKGFRVGILFHVRK